MDEVALSRALSDGIVSGAGLDVFENEPLPGNSPIRAISDRCTFSAHIGSSTREAIARINQMTTDIAFDVLGLRAAKFSKNRIV